MTIPTAKEAREKDPFGRKEGLEYPEENEIDDNPEGRGLLSDGRDQHVDDTQAHAAYYDEELRGGRPWSTRSMACIGAVMIFLLLGASFARPYLHSGTKWNEHPNSKFVGGELRSNGTTDFKRTVIIVSIDGLRYATLRVFLEDELSSPQS